MDSEISDLRKQLKTKVNILRDIENKEAAKGFDLNPLTKDELKSVEAVLWLSSIVHTYGYKNEAD